MSSFCSLLMKIMVFKGVRPPTNGKILACLRPLSMISLQTSKSRSSKAPKSEPFPQATPFGFGSATHTTLVHTETAFPITLKLQSTSTQHEQSKLTGWVFCLRLCIYVLPDLKMLSTPPKIKSKCASRPLRHNQMLFCANQRTTFRYSCQKGGEQHKKGKWAQ